MADVEHFDYYVDYVEPHELLNLRRSTDEFTSDIGFIAVNAITAGLASPENYTVDATETNLSAAERLTTSEQTIRNIGSAAYLNTAYDNDMLVPQLATVNMPPTPLGHASLGNEFRLAA